MEVKDDHFYLIGANIILIFSLFFTNCSNDLYNEVFVSVGTDGCSSEDPTIIENFWKGPGQTDVTFIAFGDTQFGKGPSNKNQLQIQVINDIENLLNWKAVDPSLDESVSNIRGVIIAGDLTQTGVIDEYEDFINTYGLCGNRDLIYSVFEGYGNHDYYKWIDLLSLSSKEHPAVDSVSIRNLYRVGITNMAEGTNGHYSWEWDNVHFVMLNLCPSNADPGHTFPGVNNPRMALEFLEQDLAVYVQGTGKRLIVISHFGFDYDFDFINAWTEKEADEYFNIISSYSTNFIAHIHGHNHKTSKYQWKGLQIYNVGSPITTDTSDGKGHFTLFKITNNRLYAGDVSWNLEYPENDIAFPARWSDVISF